MRTKDMMRNKSFCALPWTGFIVEQDGNVKNCVLAQESLGNINDRDIKDIMEGEVNTKIKKQMLADLKPKSCAGCHKLEQDKNRFDIISQRLYYLKELQQVNQDLYDRLEDFELHTVDLRWTNQCNQACVYCGPRNSTMWAKEVGERPMMTQEAKTKLKDYVYANVANLKNVYLAGGEPTLMNENIEFLTLLLEKNPSVTLRVNTNLSNTETKVAKLIRQFENVHWTVSVEATGDRYNYIRFGGDWQNFTQNLKTIMGTEHKISFNMLYLVLNWRELFNCIDYLKTLGFHDNSFVVGPLTGPTYLDLRNLPDHKLEWVRSEITKRLEHSSYLLKDGYLNLLQHMDLPFAKDLEATKSKLKSLDIRRNIDSRLIIPELYD